MRVQQVPNSPYFIHYDDEGFCCISKSRESQESIPESPSKFRVDKKQNRLIYSYPPDGPWYELKYIADELPNSLEAEISGGNQLIMNYEQAQELFGIKFRRWLGIFNL